jgi:hypothetical protein
MNRGESCSALSWPANDPWRRCLAAFAVLLLAFALTGCRAGVTGDVKALETFVNRLADGSTVTLVHAQVTANYGTPWERVLILRNGALVGLTPLVRKASVFCTSAQVCDIHVLRVGDLAPKAWVVDPARFFVPDEGTIDVSKIPAAYVVRLKMDNAMGGFPGLRAAPARLSASGALIGSLISREIPLQFQLLAMVTFVLTAVGCGLGWLVNRYVTRLNESRGSVMISFAYLMAIGMPLIVFISTLIGPGEAVMANERSMFGGMFEYPVGQAAIEPLFMALGLGLTVGAFDVLRRWFSKPWGGTTPC